MGTESVRVYALAHGEGGEVKQRAGRAVVVLLSLGLAFGVATETAAQTTCATTDVAITGVTPAPSDAAALAGDCATLLGLMDTLRGTATLNWANSLSMASWDGITLTDSRVTSLSLDSKELTGTIPTNVNSLTGLRHLYLHGNELSGQIPDLSALTSLRTLQLESNQLDGQIPTTLNSLISLRDLMLANNQLDGQIPNLSNALNLRLVRLENNKLSGQIPATLNSAASLETLRLDRNQLDGQIPDLSSPVRLTHIYLYDNKLSGTINPDHFPDSLTTAWLYSNQLSGEIPDLSGIEGLQALRLHDNKLSGTINPDYFPASLTQLLLHRNQLSGSIPDLSSLTSLQFLYLHQNQFDGLLPTQWNSLSNLLNLHLAGNPFSGGIPSQLGSLTGLTALSLCGTNLDSTATLPSALETRRSDGDLTVYSCVRIEDASATEGNPLSFAVEHSTYPVRGTAGATGGLTLGYEVEDDTATSADDTGTAQGSVTIPANTDTDDSTSNAAISVPTTDDTDAEAGETLTVTLKPADPDAGWGPLILLRRTAIGTILDNDAPPPPPPPSAPPPPDPSVPEAPRQLTAVGGYGEVVLRWEAPASDGHAAITDYEYRIDRRPPWTSTGSTGTAHTVSGLVSGRTYVFEVRAVNRLGRSSASNRAEATPKAPEVLNFTHFANGDGIASDLVFVNVGTRPVRPALYFYDTEGSPIAAETVVDIAGDLEVAEDGALTVGTGMEPLGELTVSTHGREALVTGSVKVVSEGSVGGMLRYDLPHVGQAVVRAATPIGDAIFPVRRRQGGINTGVAIHNLESTGAVVDCELLREGVPQDAVSIALAANGQTSWSIDQAFTEADTSNFAGSVRCDAVGRARFSAIALETDSDTRIFATLPVLEVSPPHASATTWGTTLNFPHFANGASIISELVFVNLETRPSRPPLTPFHRAVPPTRPVIYFYDPEGEPIAPETVVDIVGDLEVTEDGALTVPTEMEPLGELTVSTHGREALVTGSVKVVSEGPIGGMLRFDLLHVGEAVVGAGAAASDAIFPVRRRQGGINTGVAIHNLESTEAVVDCELLREGVLLDAVSIALAANGQTSWSIDEAFTAADTSEFSGSVRCTAVGDGQFTAIALEMDPGTRTFTTLPVVEVEERMSQE